MWKRPLFFLGILAMGLNTIANEADEEFRGVWVARFAWASPDGKRCRDNITAILDAAAENNLNAVVFQVRGAAETLYPSKLEPWSPLVGNDGPGFDAVEFAIAAGPITINVREVARIDAVIQDVARDVPKPDSPRSMPSVAK